MVLATFSETHLILLAIIGLLLFGGKKLPEFARGLGEAMKEFKKAQREISIEEQQAQAQPKPVVQQPVAATTVPTVPTTPTDLHKPA